MDIGRGTWKGVAKGGDMEKDWLRILDRYIYIYMNIFQLKDIKW